MSHQYPYRRTPSDADLRPDPGPYGSSDRRDRHVLPHQDFYRPPPPQESLSSSSSSSSRGPAQWTQDGALSILSSCGLEPSDLSLLAELPEDVLTVESLPQVLKQIKGKRGTVKPFPPHAASSSSSSYAHSSAHRPTSGPTHRATSSPAHQPAFSSTHRATSSLGYQPASSSTHQPASRSTHRPGLSSTHRPGLSSTHRPGLSSTHRPASSFSAAGDWDQLRSEPVQYPLDQLTPSYLPSDQLQNHWGPPRTNSSVRVDPSSSASSSLSSLASSSSSMYTVDFHRRPGPPEYGKTSGASGSGSGSGSVQDRASFRSKGPGQRTRPSRFSEPGSSDHRPARPPPTTAPSSSSSSMPSPKAALDFHGTCPQVYPYSCSLCDITVLSEKVWIKHINGTQHADGQLHLLQQFPNWDCRVETVSRGDSQSEKRTEEEKPAQPLQTTNQSQKLQPNKPPQKKASDKGKVVCVKFPAQSVDETYLRKLMEPFGKIVKILMFPSLAFVELGSPDQAKDLVKFHVNYPPTVNGEQIQFSISNTFSFLQSSRVVSFSPAPTGDDGRSDLLSIVKRFGPPLYTLFLPSIAFVEMKNAPDAQKLVDYYSSNNLKINSDFLKVSFSGEYKSLMRVASAKRYEEEEEESSTKRLRGQSQEEAESEAKRRRGQSREGAESDTKRRSSSKDRAEERWQEGGKSRRDRRSRSRSRDKSSRETRTRTRSKSRSRSRDKNSRDRRSRSRDKSSRETRTRVRSRSRSRDKSSSSSSQQSGSRVKTEEPDSDTRTDPEPAPVTDVKPETTQTEPSEDEAESSAEDSDIEGMEVIGEDGENLREEDEDHLDEEDKEEQNDEEEVKEEDAERKSGEPERHDSPGEEKEKEVKDGETVEEEKREEEEEEEEDSGTSREPEKAAETVEDEEEDPGFPVDLDDCIVMDEVEEEQSDDSDVTSQPEVRGHHEVTAEPEVGGHHEVTAEPEVGGHHEVTAEPEVRGHHEVTAEPESSTRVVYFTNLPQRFYTDADFVRLVRDYGTPTRYFLIRHRQEGFVEMSSSSEALTAAQELGSNKPVIFHGSKLSVHVSHKYHRLVNGWDIHSDSDSDSERRNEHRSQSSRGERRSKSRTSDRDETGRRSGSKSSSERETSFRTSPEECSEKKTEEQDVNNTTEPVARTRLESGSKTSTEPESTENDLANQESPAEESHAKTTSEKPEIESEEVSKETEETSRGHEEETRKGTEEREGSADQGPETNGPDSAADPPEPQTHQKPGDDERLQDLDQKPGPAGGAAGPERPSRPVGTEFIRPVVGYFCHLCQVIYADEDEAKLQHCSSDAHYRKYQEKTGKNPWTS